MLLASKLNTIYQRLLFKVIGIIVIVGRIYLYFLSVIEIVHVLLITGLSYSFTLFFSRYSSFSVIHSIYLITYITLSCHRQWLVYKQKNINNHGSAEETFTKIQGGTFRVLVSYRRDHISVFC